jgi:hypothetical protein
MLVLSQYHIFESYKTNIYRVQQMRCMGIAARTASSHPIYWNFFLSFHEIIKPVPQYGMWQYLYISTTFKQLVDDKWYIYVSKPQDE